MRRRSFRVVRGSLDCWCPRSPILSLLIGATNGESARTEAWTTRMIEHGVEGLAIMTFMEEPESVYEVAKNTPIVQVDVGQSISGVTTVPINYESGIRQAVQHLAALGHRDIVFAAGPDHEFTPRARKVAFEYALTEIAVPIGEQSIYSEHHTLEGGIEAAKRILKRRNFPTAVVCSNDLMAIGILRVFIGAGKSVPGDVSLIGLDDIHLAEFTVPALTTIRIPREELADICFETLLRRLDKTFTEISVPGISTTLVVRGSTDFPRHAPGNLMRTPKARG
jgi:DNA-binding LacI/PurR family transcriptional regulator